MVNTGTPRWDWFGCCFSNSSSLCDDSRAWCLLPRPRLGWSSLELPVVESSTSLASRSTGPAEGEFGDRWERHLLEGDDGFDDEELVFRLMLFPTLERGVVAMLLLVAP
jgi:hypothetical protein